MLRGVTPEELAIINKYFAKKELKGDDIYVFDVHAANTSQLTAYHSRLGEDMIRGFHADVVRRQSSQEAELVGFLFGHDKDRIPSGTLFNAVVGEDDLPDGKKSYKFLPTVFMLRDLNVGGINTDEYIKAYEAGHTEAVSVGFQAGSYICDLCNKDIRSMLCEHMPGNFYNMAAEGAVPDMRRCTYTIHQGSVKERNIVELSGVYAGALPGARITGFSIPANTEPKDGKFIGKDGLTVLSANIKDFKENDVLLFNCSFDGSIEKVGVVGAESSLSGGEDNAEDKTLNITIVKKYEEKIQQLNAELEGYAEAKSRLLVLQTELDTIKATHDKLQKDFDALKTVLGMSEADKVDLQAKLYDAQKKIARLDADVTRYKAVADDFLSNLKARCKKLSVQVNGQHFNEDLFEKEVKNFSIAELQVKIAGLEAQLVELIPTERKTQDTGSVHSVTVGKNGEVIRPEQYKIKKD